MMLTVKEAFNHVLPKSTIDLAEVSDKLWQIGSLAEIQQKISPELFTIHIGINVIGSWESDGWHEIISSQPSLLPYIPAVMEATELAPIGKALQDVLAVFPAFILFSEDSLNSDLYYDAINFLQNPRIKIKDEKLNSYTQEERSNMCRQYRNKLNTLEKISESLWTSGTSNDQRWQSIFQYVHGHF